MKRVVLGTAGHIDHGKSTLVKALTGIDPDRLKEEKERGITIELGYSRLFLEPDLVIGIVDVPGHEKFVKTMVSGATGVDMVLLVVAADEGVMAQTREHFEICRLLGVERGLVAITKVDLVDQELVELVEEEVRELVKGSFLEGAPIVRVDSVSGRGLDELREAIREVALKTPSKPDDRPFRMYIDRVFTLKGFGTVVTGTSISGKVRVGDELDVLPLGKTVKVRGIQVYGNKTQEALSSMRVALNLSGVEKSELERGHCLSEKGAFKETDTILVELVVSELFGHPVKNEGVYRFLAGCSISLAKIYLPEGREIPPGGRGIARIKLDRPMVLIHGDRFILRGSGTLQTYGGGMVLDPFPPKMKAKDLALYGRSLLGREIEVSILETLRAHKGLPLKEMTTRYGLSEGEASFILKVMEDKGLVSVLGGFVIPKESFEELKGKLVEMVKEFHKKHPMRPGVSKEELRSRLGVEEEVFEGLINELGDLLKVEGELVAVKGFTPSLPEDIKEVANKILKIYKDSFLTPPMLKEIVKDHGKEVKEVVEFFERRGDLVKVNQELYVHRDAFDVFIEKARSFKDGFSVQDIKRETGLTRKYLIPYLELMDKIGLTFRAGDKRYFKR